MKYLVSFLIFFFSFQNSAEEIFMGEPLNCKNLEWFVSEINLGWGESLLENDDFKNEFCKVSQTICNKNIDSNNLHLKFSSSIGYAFSFHKLNCNNQVDYNIAAEHYLKAFTRPNGKFGGNGGRVYFNSIMKKLIKEASKNQLDKKDLSKILDIYELVNLKYGKEDLKYQDDFNKIEMFYEYLDYGEGDDWHRLDTRFIIDFYKKAAECNWAQGQSALGKTLIYGTLGGEYKGRPTIINYVEGYKWLIIAKQNGYKVSKNEIDWIENKLSPGQITDAQDRAYNWQESCPKL